MLNNETNYITFQSVLNSTDNNSKLFKYGRVRIYNNIPIIEVFNTDDDAIPVKGFTIPLVTPYTKLFKHGRVFVNSSISRVGIQLSFIKKENNKRYFNILLSRYIWTINNKDTDTTDLEIDHKDENKLNDRLYNLIPITRTHNHLKNNYGSHWLDIYNRDNNSNYTISDLSNINTLKLVISYIESVRDKYNKESKSIYYNDNKDTFLSNAKQYYKDNKDDIINRVNNYYNKNREKRLDKMKEYRNKNKIKLIEKKKDYYENNKNTFLEKRKQYREQNREDINLKQRAAWKLNTLIKQTWTKEIGKEIIIAIDNFFTIYKTTRQEIVKGLDVKKYDHREIRKLHQLLLLYSKQLDMLQNSI